MAHHVFSNAAECVPCGRRSEAPYERRKGRKFQKALPEFGECIWFLLPESKGENKLDSRWEEGIYLGLKDESNELIVGNKEGVRKIRSWAKKPEGDRWAKEKLDEMKGVPWEPIPGRGIREIKAHVTLPESSTDGGILEEPSTREVIPRRVKIGKEDIARFGMTIGCPGCIAANRGKVANHSEKCRNRMEKRIKEKDPDRYGRAAERLAAQGGAEKRQRE